MLVDFEVGEQADLLEHFEFQVLRLVDDQDDIAALLNAIEQHPVHLRNEVVLAARQFCFTKLGEDRLEHLRFGDPWVENQGGVVVSRIQIIQELSAERRLPASHFPDQNDKTLLFANAVFQMLEGLLVSRAEIKKPRVRRNVERHLAKPVKALIHVGGYVGNRGGTHAKLTVPAAGGFV